MKRAPFTYAYAWRYGRIDFGRRVPGGAIEIAKDRDEQRLRDLICATARHAYDGVTLLVPGVPEAESEEAAADALVRWRDWITTRNSAKASTDRKAVAS